MPLDVKDIFFANVRSILREISKIKAPCGYSTQDILLAMIASAIITKPLPVPIKKD